MSGRKERPTRETEVPSSLSVPQPRKARKLSSSRTGASSASKWNGSEAGRNVGGGRGVEHIGEDGTLWMDVEEEVCSSAVLSLLRFSLY